MSLPLLSPSLIEELQQTEPYMVVIFNDDAIAYDLVVATLILATKCSQDEAEMETWEAHHFGKASVHFGSREECQETSEIITRVGIKAEVRKEWSD